MRIQRLAATITMMLCLLTAPGCNQNTPTPTASGASLATEAQKALAGAASYHWVSTFSIKTSAEPEAATVIMQGERTREPDAEQVALREQEQGDLQAGWVRVGTDLWLYNLSNQSWMPLPASAATEAIGRLQFLDPTQVWQSLAGQGIVNQSEKEGTELDGRPTLQIAWEQETTPSFLPVNQITPTQPVQFSAWLDRETRLPLRTSMTLEGTNAKNESGTMQLDIQLSAVGQPLAIAPPEGAPTLPGASSQRVTEALADGTALPLAPGAQETLPETLPDQLKTLVQTFSLLGNEERIALQVYTSDRPQQALDEFFTTSLPAGGWTINERVPGQYTPDALSLLASNQQRNAQIILLPLGQQTLVITTLQ
jgi:hypothetical protein